MTMSLPPIRRVVTGHDQKGRAIVLADETISPLRRPDASMVSSHIWLTDAAPADIENADDGKEKIVGTAPPDGGTRFGILDIAPGNTQHPPHRTDTVDYIICLAGAVDLEIDGMGVTLKAGDILVQRGTNHAWVNRGTEPARLAFVLIDGTPKRAGSLGATGLAR
jgi:quercetin dioxygenase-like cupin family protein